MINKDLKEPAPTNGFDIIRRGNIEFIPEESGEYAFSCGMNMIRGVLEVQHQLP